MIILNFIIQSTTRHEDFILIAARASRFDIKK